MGESTTIDNQPTGIRRWIIDHDDSWLFIIAYIGLAVVLSIWISLFWLVAVVAVHLAFEVVRQKATHEQWTTIISQALWELKLDIALVLFALVVSLYMEVVLGVVGLQGVARAGAATQAGLRGGARFAAWQRIIRGVLLSVDGRMMPLRWRGWLWARGTVRRMRLRKRPWPPSHPGGAGLVHGAAGIGLPLVWASSASCCWFCRPT